jgi:oligosaccharide repeat unit polymerase
MHRVVQGSMEEALFQRSNIRTRGFWWSSWFCIVTSPLLSGVIALWSEELWLLHYLVPAAYVALLYSFVISLHTSRDLLNPLCLFLIIGFVRFFLAGILFSSGVEPPDEVYLFFQWLHLSDSHWQWGHALALVASLAGILGWLFIPGQWTLEKPLKFHLTDGGMYASLVGMLVGFMALAAFFFMNASSGALTSGEFRGVTIQKGTGKYFSMAYLLIAGSVLLCCYLLSKGFTWLALIPVGVAMLLYWPLGGRGRAVTSVIGGLFLLWYQAREHKGWRKLSFKPVHLLKVTVGVLCIILFSYLGSHTRGSSGGRALSDAFSFVELWSYVGRSIYIDLGQLASLAAAIKIGPAVLEGRTFLGALTWPLSKFMPIPGGSAGVYIVETLGEFASDDRKKWGVAASLVGDAYLNFGLLGVVAVMFLYGALLKILYLKFRQGVLHSAIYSLAIVMALKIFMGSIEVWSQALTTLSFVVVLILLGKTFFTIQRPDVSTGELARGR